MPDPPAKKVLLIGWDAADWKIINPLLDRADAHPERFVNHGVMGNLATLHPMLSPMLWNSIATGKRPDKHGILGFIEPAPQTGGLRPVSSTSRKVKAIWNILTQRGYKTHVMGWLAGPSRRADQRRLGLRSLSPCFRGARKDWPLPPGAVHPETRARNLCRLADPSAEVRQRRRFFPLFRAPPRSIRKRTSGSNPSPRSLRRMLHPQCGHLDPRKRALGFHGGLLQRHRSLLPRLHAFSSAAYGRNPARSIRNLQGRGRTAPTVFTT